MAKIFISYAREDYKTAKQLYEFLLSQDQEPWLDKECLLPGQKWENAIQSAIRESHFFIAMLSPNSIEKRGYVQKELRIGLEILERIPDSQIFLIPVRIDECEPTHERLRELQWVDIFSDWEGGLRQLLRVFAFVPKQVLLPTLSGTNWNLTHIGSSLGNWKIFLREDGVVEYDYLNGAHFSNGTWKQSGTIFYMEINQGYLQCKGVIDGDKLTGEAQNIDGKEWRWEAVKIR